MSSPDNPLLINNSPKVVLDTNVLLVSVSSRSPFHLIYRSFLDGCYTMCVTTDIMDEYEEILSRPEHLGLDISQFVMETIENAANVAFITRHYRWNLVKADPDDDKFVDCALVSNASYLVTNDSHFNGLKTHPFPQVRVISANEFVALLRNGNDLL